MLTPLERLERHHTVTPSGCWEWTAARDRDGYGFLTIGSGPEKKYHRAHRLSYETFVGDVPKGRVVDHLCGNRACINPEHLEPVTQRVNLDRAERTRKTRTRCARGHEFTPENTIERRDGGRSCRTCTLDRRRANYAAQKVAA